MKKVALIFISAVLIPSFLLALLAIRSLRDQQLVLERQQMLLCQEVINSLFKDFDLTLAEKQREFTALLQKLIADRNPADLAPAFDQELAKIWPLARVGFVVSLHGEVLAPSLFASPEARRFRLENDHFFCNKEIVEVYWNSPKGNINLSQLDRSEPAHSARTVYASKSGPPFPTTSAEETEFKALIGSASEGTLARYLQNRLNLFFWSRLERDPNLVFGAQIDVPLLASELAQLLRVEPSLHDQIAVGLLNDQGHIVASSHPALDWRRPYLTLELGDSLPHWKLGLLLLDPGRIHQTAKTIRLTLGLLITALLLAIGTGSWLIIRDLQRQLTLARQKTDFVSNVSHELKTPLTSIRMFAELLQSPNLDPAKQRDFLQVINTETARLTRLINNVLDFARMERGERRYHHQTIDLVNHLTPLLEAYRPHLQKNGLNLQLQLPPAQCLVNADPDALSQAVVNLISNAEKYAAAGQEILVRLQPHPHQVSLQVCDRGPGVPKGMEEKIFEQFCRAHDSLNSGIPGSGLGLTLARQIARAHNGDLRYRPRSGGGSCFELNLPAHEAKNLGR